MVRPRKHSDEEILGAAREVFLKHGPAASTNLIAEAVGLSQPALFKRFGTKEQLLIRALMPGPNIAWVQALEAGPDERPIHEQLEQVLLLAMDFFDGAMPCLMTLKAADIDFPELMRAMPEPPPLRARRTARDWFQRAMDQGRIRPTNADAAALTLIGSIQARAAMSHIFGEARPTADERLSHVRAVADLLWRGLCP